jgi:hypothetical protein
MSPWEIIFYVIFVLSIGGLLALIIIYFGYTKDSYSKLVNNERLICPTYMCEVSNSEGTQQAWRLDKNGKIMLQAKIGASESLTKV